MRPVYYVQLNGDVSLGVNPDSEQQQQQQTYGPAADVARLFFDAAWAAQLKKRGVEGLVFPREIVWLSGAPGAGKGSVSGFLMQVGWPWRFRLRDRLRYPFTLTAATGGGLRYAASCVISYRFISVCSPLLAAFPSPGARYPHRV